MGKARRKKGKHIRNQTDIHSCTSTNDNQASYNGLNPGSEIINRIIHQLQSESTAERECACNSLSMMTSSRTDEILSAKVSRIAAPLMLDSSLSIRHAATGAMNNLSSVNDSACQRMVHQDIMTPLCSQLRQSFQTYFETAGNRKDRNEKNGDEHLETTDQSLETFIEGICLLSNLCQVSQEAVMVLEKTDIISEVLIGSLKLVAHASNLSGSNFRLVKSVLRCLLVLIEDNMRIQGIILEHANLFEVYLNSTEDILLIKCLVVSMCVHVAGNNISSERWHPLPFSTSEILFCIIFNSLKIDQRNMSHEFTSVCPLDVDSAGICTRRISMAYEEIVDLVEAQIVSLEILANLAFEDDEALDNGVVEMEVNDFSGHSNETSMVEFLSQAVFRFNLFDIILSKSILPAENVLLILESQEYNVLHQKLLSLRDRSFFCIANLFDGLTLFQLGGDEAVSGMWKELIKKIDWRIPEEQFRSTSEINKSSFIDAFTSALRAVSQKLTTVASDNDPWCPPHFFPCLFEFYRSDKSIEISLNVVNIVGNLGSIFSRFLKHNELTSSIADFLLTALTSISNCVLAAEIVDKIFDMFSEDDTDQISVAIGLVPKLKTFVKSKEDIILQWQQMKDVNEVVESARDNLEAFISYKSQRSIILHSLQNGR